MNTPKKKGPTKAQLQRKVKELEAQQASTYHFASLTLPKAANAMASAVIVELTGLGGKEIIPPTAIVNGLSEDTIAALQRDIVRSWKYKTELKPAGLKDEEA